MSESVAARAQMQAEAQSLRQLLSSTNRADEDEPFSVTVARAQTVDRIRALEEEMAELETDSFDLSFASSQAPAAHSLPTSTLANLLSRFQRALTYAGWARLAGPGVGGDPPALVARAFETQVNALVPGSFVVALSPHEQSLEHDALHGAFDDFLGLAEAGAGKDGPSNDAVAEIAQGLGTQATR